ncbi:hypothetical protein TNCV_491661 [Trichonephila clavipes]|nr:hypothetical protein TNCV_491661 [Trichonephila clavipes]
MAVAANHKSRNSKRSESFHYPPPINPPCPGLATGSRKERGMVQPLLFISYLMASLTTHPVFCKLVQGSEYDIYEGGDHNRSLRCFPTDFLCHTHSLGIEAVTPLSSIFIQLVGFSRYVKGCRAMTKDKTWKYLGVHMCIVLG